jgi:hypothetical protein
MHGLQLDALFRTEARSREQATGARFDRYRSQVPDLEVIDVSMK